MSKGLKRYVVREEERDCGGRRLRAAKSGFIRYLLADWLSLRSHGLLSVWIPLGLRELAGTPEV